MHLPGSVGLKGKVECSVWVANFPGTGRLGAPPYLVIAAARQRGFLLCLTLTGEDGVRVT